MLRGAPQTTVTTQGKQQAPLGIRAGVEDLASHLLSDKERSGRIALVARLTAGKRVLGDNLLADSRLKELLGPLDGPRCRCLGSVSTDPATELVGVARSDIP